MNVAVERLISSFKESFIMALTAIRTNKLRSSLTLLGVAVGVFSIIVVMTAMGVLLNSIQEGMSELGTNVFQVQKNDMSFSNGPRDQLKNRNRKYLTYEQCLEVKEKTTLAKMVGIEAYQNSRVVKSGALKTNPNVSLFGENVEGFTTNNWTVGEGRMYSQQEFTEAKTVAIVGKNVVEKLFPKTDPIGKTIEIDGQIYEIIGTIESRGEMLGGDNDNMIVVPLTAFFGVYGKNRDIHAMIETENTETFDDCEQQVRGILRAARNVAPGQDDDFGMFSNDSMIDQFNDLTSSVRLGIMLVSAIALLASGVGIMNIMLVSVTERTREIGIRKSIGARKSNILSQFILEAVLLSEMGGIFGIVTGVLAGNILAIVMDVPAIIPYDWVAIGFVTCSIIGIIFGVYPAWKASNLDPIESLRYE
jgi:putative ABC transport system permease protein